MRTTKGYWLWGLFPTKETNLLNQLKAKVQIKLKSPFFENHITLAGPYFNIDETFVKKIKSFGENTPKIILEFDGYAFKQEIFKSFYITIKTSQDLKEIRKNIYKLNKFDLKNNYYPHISLSYGNHEIKAKKELMSKLPKIIEPITMSKVALVEVSEDINLWKILESFDLN